MRLRCYVRPPASVLLALSLLCSPAGAQLTPIERATAEALFQEGVSLVDRGNYAEACEKFAATLEIEAGLGTMLHLADCYDKVDRTASSWALFEEVAARSKSTGDLTRHAVAVERASELKKRLTLLYLRFEETPSQDGTTFVELGGTRIPQAMWSSPIPVDPGAQRLVVGAVGHQPWETTLALPRGPAQQRVVIPALLPLTPQRPAPASPTPLGASPHPVAGPIEGDNSSGSTLRALGYVTGALGLVGLGVGGYFGYRAHESNRKSLEDCRVGNPNLCTPDGVANRQRAQRYAQAANLAVIAGGFGVVVGSTFLLVSPSSGPSSEGVSSSFPLLEPTLLVRGVF